MPPKVSILVLQYNNSEATLKCLESLKGLRYSNFDVVVIDNASEEYHRQAVEKFIHQQINTSIQWHFIRNNDNHGYAGGNNVGIRFVLGRNAEYILILNNDTEVKPELLDKLIHFAQELKSDISGSAIQTDHAIEYQGEFRWLRIPKHITDKPESRRLRANEYLTGAAILINRKVFEKIGLLDERYFLYYEEADFYEKAKRRGFTLGIYPEPLLRHDVSLTTRTLGKPMLFYYHYRNACFFNARWAPLPYKFLLPFASLWLILKQLIKIVVYPSKRAVSKAILRGVIDFFRGRMGKVSNDLIFN